MTARRSILLQLLALAVAVAMSLCAIPFLRSWAPEGEAVLGPLMVVGVLSLTLAFVRGRGVPSQGLYAALALAGGLFSVGHAFLLGGAILKSLFPLRMMLAVAFGAFFGIAPVMARVEQNPWFGVRTPWTLGSRRVWKETHRATGRLWLVGGAAGSFLTMFGAPLPLVASLWVALALAPVAISYAVWRRLGRP